MARDFDGAGDNISFGSDASVDDFSQKSVLAWIHAGTTSGAGTVVDDVIGKSDGVVVVPTGWQVSAVATLGVSTGHLQFVQDFSITDGTWVTANSSVAAGTDHHIAVVYDRGATANNPTVYIDGASVGITETGSPSGSSNGDAAQNLRMGEDDGGNNDWTGRAAFLVYDSTLFTAADVNRHYWYGCAPGGPSTVDVWHPMLTDDLTNKGTATANGTATGTTVVSMDTPRVERMYMGCLGVGR